MIRKGWWKKEPAPLKQPHNSQHQPLTRSLQAAYNLKNFIQILPHPWLQRVNFATKATKFINAKVSKHFQHRTELSWSRQKDFASIAYDLDIEVNDATVQLLRSANESTTVVCIWKPITTRGQLQQRQELQLAARHLKKQAIKQRKQSTKTKKNLQPQRSRGMKKKRSIPSHRNRFKWQKRKNNWYQSHSRLRIPKQPHHGRCSTTPWIEKRKSRWRSSRCQQLQRISKFDSENKRWKLNQH